jgi:steroid delta-isomerase-like uncharacterized protein
MVSANGPNFVDTEGDMANVSELLQQWVATFNESRWDDALNLASEDALEEEIGTGRRMNRQESLEAAKGWKAAFPDARGQIVRTVASGNEIAAEIVWEGTHRGDLNGLAPTGRSARVEAAVFLQEQDGRIVRIRHHIDVAGMMAQLGVTSMAGQAEPVGSA